MDVSDQLQDPAVLPPEKRVLCTPLRGGMVWPGTSGVENLFSP